MCGLAFRGPWQQGGAREDPEKRLWLCPWTSLYPPRFQAAGLLLPHESPEPLKGLAWLCRASQPPPLPGCLPFLLSAPLGLPLWDPRSPGSPSTPCHLCSDPGSLVSERSCLVSSGISHTARALTENCFSAPKGASPFPCSRFCPF